jgi:hypothetical protein
VRNIGGEAGLITIPVKVDGHLALTDSVRLQPGDSMTVTSSPLISGEGIHQVQVKEAMITCKVYDHALASVILDFSPEGIRGDSVVEDGSGFGNHARIIGHGSSGEGKGSLVRGKDSYLEVAHAPSLDRMGETLTMMVRVFPLGTGEHLMDILSKGDNHVLQVSGNRELTFFAGGWGRGDCTVPLPEDWSGHWHYIAGVCTGSQLKLYIDGVLKGVAHADGSVNLSVDNKWVAGRNEEFPGQRAFNGLIDKVKVFAEPLTDDEVMSQSKK